MEFFIQFFVIIPIFSTTIVPNSEIDKNNKRFAALEQQIQTLRQKISYTFEFCQLQPDDICAVLVFVGMMIDYLKNITATVKICNQNVIAWNLNNMVSK